MAGLHPLEIALLGLSAGLAGMTSYEDIRFGKIRNRWIFPGTLVGVALHIVLACLIGLHTGPAAAFGYATEVLANGAIALILGFGLWRSGFWSAGDAKLFGALALIVPLSSYARGYLKIFPSGTILINTFLLAMAFVLPKWIHWGIRHSAGGIRAWWGGRHKWSLNIGIGTMPRWLGPPLLFASLFFMGRRLGSVFPIVQKTLENGVFLLALVALGRPLGRFGAKPRMAWKLIIVCAGYLGYSAAGGVPIPQRDLLLAGVVGLAVPMVGVALNALFDRYSESDTREVRADELRPYDRLAASSVEWLRARQIPLPADDERLLPEDLRALQSRLTADTILKTHRGLPFAPFLAAGVTATVLTGQSLLHLIIKT